jgi:hypothetical protein
MVAVRGSFNPENLIPRPPNFEPRRGYGWICFCVFNEDGKIVDTITCNEAFEKGFSNVFGELQFPQLMMAKEMYADLRAQPGKRIVNSALLQ